MKPCETKQYPSTTKQDQQKSTSRTNKQNQTDPSRTKRNYPPGAVSYMLMAADKGDISTIIGGIAPDWGPFGSLGNEARVMIEVVMAVAILLCLGIAIWGAAKQRIGATALRDTFSAEQGKGLIIAGLTGVFIIGSLGTLFTIVYGMAV